LHGRIECHVIPAHPVLLLEDGRQEGVKESERIMCKGEDIICAGSNKITCRLLRVWPRRPAWPAV